MKNNRTIALYTFLHFEGSRATIHYGFPMNSFCVSTSAFCVYLSMSKRCSICSRGARSGQRRSHSNIKTKRRFGVNLQWRTINDKRTRICTRCLKTRTKHATSGKAKK